MCVYWNSGNIANDSPFLNFFCVDMRILYRSWIQFNVHYKSVRIIWHCKVTGLFTVQNETKQTKPNRKKHGLLLACVCMHHTIYCSAWFHTSINSSNSSIRATAQIQKKNTTKHGSIIIIIIFDECVVIFRHKMLFVMILIQNKTKIIISVSDTIRIYVCVCALWQ